MVTTIGMNGKTWLDRAGNFAGPDVKVTERFTLLDPDHIRYQATLEDPKTYSRPWTIEMPLYRSIEQNAEFASSTNASRLRISFFTAILCTWSRSRRTLRIRKKLGSKYS